MKKKQNENMEIITQEEQNTKKYTVEELLILGKEKNEMDFAKKDESNN